MKGNAKIEQSVRTASLLPHFHRHICDIRPSTFDHDTVNVTKQCKCIQTPPPRLIWQSSPEGRRGTNYKPHYAIANPRKPPRKVGSISNMFKRCHRHGTISGKPRDLSLHLSNTSAPRWEGEFLMRNAILACSYFDSKLVLFLLKCVQDH